MKQENRALYAHTPPPGSSRWHPLDEHLQAVADLAGEFASRFGAAEIARLAGLCHDAGKAHPGFQRYLQACHLGESAPRTPHSIWGAALARRVLGADGGWDAVALPVAGHHGGLKDPGQLEGRLLEAWNTVPSKLKGRLSRLFERLHPPSSITLPKFQDDYDRELFVRMVFSTLIDADRLDTERFLRPDRFTRRAEVPEIAALWERFEANQRRLMENAPETPVNRVRAEVYRAAVETAQSPPGVFRLTAPTGAGKTRSGLAFALRHAVVHGLERVVVAIPYTSIIEQTADEYRRILGEEAVLEHHSQVDMSESEDQDIDALCHALAVENWNAPLIVTTMVQLFESLFGDRPSHTRKIHRLARSVVYLDEVQTLPTGLLEPTTDALRKLVDRYGASLVLSTATQPALTGTPIVSVLRDLDPPEIVPDYSVHFQALRRVRYDFWTEPCGWDELADEITVHDRALVVLNTRRDALSVVDALDGTGDVLHLSTLLCAAHRRDVLREVRHRLAEGTPVRLVSTQVVEAGVDLDFPVAYRAIGPWDRIVQVAGRCNREGRLESLGSVVIFEPAEGATPRGPYRTGLELARYILNARGPAALHDPASHQEYFRRLYRDVNLDVPGIQVLRREQRYPEVAASYRLIPDDTVPVLVNYTGRGFELGRAYAQRPDRTAWRRLQPYLVNIYRRDLPDLERDSWVQLLTDGLYRWTGDYDEIRGLRKDLLDPTDLYR